MLMYDKSSVRQFLTIKFSKVMYRLFWTIQPGILIGDGISG